MGYYWGPQLSLKLSECKYIPEMGTFANFSYSECYVLPIFVLYRRFCMKRQ